MSRTAHLRSIKRREPERPTIDVRWFSGILDPSEMPSAYKNTAAIKPQIARFGLARTIDHAGPYGPIMAGDWQADGPWKRGKAERAAAGA